MAAATRTPGRGLGRRPLTCGSLRPRNLSDGEPSWIIENGIRFTGMPAWGHWHEGGSKCQPGTSCTSSAALPRADARRSREKWQLDRSHPPISASKSRRRESRRAAPIALPPKPVIPTDTEENRCLHHRSLRPYSRWSPLWRSPDPRRPTQGHPHKVMGTVTTRHDNHLEVKAADGKTWAITLNDKTRILRGKTPVKADDIKAGERVVVTAMETKGKDGKATMAATEVRLARRECRGIQIALPPVWRGHAGHLRAHVRSPQIAIAIVRVDNKRGPSSTTLPANTGT